MASTMEDIIEEAKSMYSNMQLLELLVEENIMTEFLHKRKSDPIRRKLMIILRSEIAKKLP